MSDIPSAFKTTTRKAAKEHKCCECGDTINKGDQYQYSSGIWGGEPSSFKQCLNCHEIMEAAIISAEYADEGPSFGCLRIWFEDFQCLGLTGHEWLSGMAKEIRIEEEKLNRLLRVTRE